MAGSISKTFQALCSGKGPMNNVYIITIDWVADADDATIPSLTLDAEDNCILGWFLYSAKTIPGAGAAAPQALYDITIKDTDGLDIAGTLLTNRSESAIEQVNFGNTAFGFPVVESDLVVAVAGNNVDSASGQIVLTFTPE